MAKRQRLLSDDRSNSAAVRVGSRRQPDSSSSRTPRSCLLPTSALAAAGNVHTQRRFSPPSDAQRHLSGRVAACSTIEALQARSSIAASRVGENSYSSGVDPAVGLALIDRFTDSMLEFFERRQSQHHSQRTTVTVTAAAAQHWMEPAESVGDLVSSLDPSRLMSHPVARTDLFPQPLSRTPLTAFFAADHQPHASSSRADTYPPLALLAAAEEEQHSEQPATARSATARSTSTADGRIPSSSARLLLSRLTLPAIAPVELRTQLRAAEKSQPRRTQSSAVWPAVAAAACVAVPLLCWLLEQTNSATRKLALRSH